MKYTTKSDQKSRLSLMGNMTEKGADLAGLVLALSAPIAATLFGIAAVIAAYALLT